MTWCASCRYWAFRFSSSYYDISWLELSSSSPNILIIIIVANVGSHCPENFSHIYKHNTTLSLLPERTEKILLQHHRWTLKKNTYCVPQSVSAKFDRCCSSCSQRQASSFFDSQRWYSRNEDDVKWWCYHKVTVQRLMEKSRKCILSQRWFDWAC